MPPAIWPVLIISLIVVLSSSTSSLRRSVIMAILAPTVVTLFVWLLNMFFASDYAMGRRGLIGVTAVFVPSLLACLVAALLMTFLRRRSTQK
jgi:dihydrodipicolinate synthase/N-acetylneuraminate lyase